MPVINEIDAILNRPPATGEKRSAPRSRLQVALQVSPAAESESTSSSDAKSIPAWTGNISATGICFRSRTRLKLERIAVQTSGSPETISLRIVRERPLDTGLWEYGATVCGQEERSVFQLPANEFQSLLAAFGSVVPDGDQTLAATETDDEANRHAVTTQLLLSLREVTQYASTCVDRAKQRQRERNNLRLLLWVMLVAGLACLSINQFAAQLRQFWEAMSGL